MENVVEMPRKVVGRRRTLFPGKQGYGLSFNLTALGRQLLKEQAAAAGISVADYVELLIRSRIDRPPLRLPSSARLTGPKGGAKSFFFGKNRGTTTAITSTAEARRLIDEMVKQSQMSRGDFIEFLVREKANLLSDELKVCSASAQSSGTIDAQRAFNSDPAP